MLNGVLSVLNGHFVHPHLPECDPIRLFSISKLWDHQETTHLSKAAKQRGGGQTGGFPNLDSSVPIGRFLSFLGLFRFFSGFSRFVGTECPGIFPICPFPLCRRTNSTYKEQYRKGPRHNPDLSRKKWDPPRFGNPPVSSSQTWKILKLRRAETHVLKSDTRVSERAL